MKDDIPKPDDVKLSTLLRAARPESELPPGFQAGVWHRIEKRDALSESVIARLTQWFVTPRLATAAVVVVLVLAAGAGAVRGVQKGDREARERYVASVDPSYLQR